jgi:DNA-binding XRE family transcriptional regulator
MTLENPRPVGLKKLKKIIGHKGESFAQLVGVPYDTLKSIESGRGKMSKDVAHKIRLAIGVMTESLYKRTPKNLFGREYTEADFHDWRGRFLSLGKDKKEARAHAEELAEWIGFYTKVLLLAAVEEGKKVTYGALHLEIASVIRDLAKKHGLAPVAGEDLKRSPIGRELLHFSLSDEWEMTKGEWKAEPELRQRLKVTDRDLARVGDYDPYKASRTVYPAWNPEGKVNEQALKPKS